MEPADIAREAVVQDATKPVRPVGEPEASVNGGVPNRFRLLKWNEVVNHGDFVADDRGGFELWEGLSGFRAGAFVKPIYRQNKDRRTATK